MESKGHLHPLTGAMREIQAIFSDMGFAVATGNQIIPEKENFDLLNFPPDHPARDTHDTFWIKGTYGTKEPVVPRTHISSLQVPYMLEHGAPLRMISMGPVFRAEATDATHEVMFHYMEGILVDKDVTLGHFKWTIEQFFTKFLGTKTEIRLRPGNFPFVEPGLEVDMLFKSPKGEQWLEIMGAGMVHPQVLRNGNVDPEQYTGFAFGVGINRLMMVRNGIDDVRLFYNGDLRFVNQF